jgi:DNA-binding response OmpR family regulator
MHRILVIDDDVQNLKLLEEFLAPSYAVESTSDPAQGARMATRVPLPSVVIVDVDMPGMNGFEVCEQIRASDPHSNTAILFMSSDARAASMQKALHLGANDYLVKPVRMQELLNRIELRLNQAHADAPIRVGNLVVKPDSLSIVIEGHGRSRRARITEKGFKVLQLLLRSEGRIVTRDQLMDHAWQGAEASDRSVDLHVFRLRKLLRGWDHTIEAVYGKGYVVVKKT